MISNKPITEILNIVEEPKEIEIIAPKKLSLAEMDSEEEAAKLKREEEQFNKDFENARSNILYVLDGAKESVEKMSRIADDKENAKEFEALNQLLRTVADSSSVLMNLHERKKKYRADRGGGKNSDSTTNINNAVFVGSSSEIRDLIRKMRSEENK